MMGNLKCLSRILFHHDDRTTFGVDPLNGVKDLGNNQGGETQGRFIEEDDFWIEKERACHLQDLLFATG